MFRRSMSYQEKMQSVWPDATYIFFRRYRHLSVFISYSICYILILYVEFDVMHGSYRLHVSN